jgi:hypothetical protein
MQENKEHQALTSSTRKFGPVYPGVVFGGHLSARLLFGLITRNREPLLMAIKDHLNVKHPTLGLIYQNAHKKHFKIKTNQIKS